MKHGYVFLGWGENFSPERAKILGSWGWLLKLKLKDGDECWGCSGTTACNALGCKQLYRCWHDFLHDPPRSSLTSILCTLFSPGWMWMWMWNFHISESWNTYIKFKLVVLVMRPIEHPLSSEKCIFHYDKAGRSEKALQYIHWSGFNNTEGNFSLCDSHLVHRATEAKQNFISEDSERISEENKEQL